MSNPDNVRRYTPSPPCAGCFWQSCGMRYTGSVYRCDKPDCLITRVSAVLNKGVPLVNIVTGEIVE